MTAARERPAALAAALARRFVTALDRVEIGDAQFDLLRPRNAEDLISEDDFAIDERMPYWADLWPSSVILAGRLLEEPRAGALLELGCGLGLVTMAAMRAGWRVLATDYYADALRFTRANAWRNERREPATRLVDWRALPPDLGTFERVVASDVLYERPYAALIAAVLARTIAPGGQALVADPGRAVTPEFLVACEARGLEVATRETRPFRAGKIAQRITIFQLQQGAK
ncbi:MAG: methyltransferase domain-containing protein [Gemmatimonadaceae bacterium]